MKDKELDNLEKRKPPDFRCGVPCCLTCTYSSGVEENLWCRLFDDYRVGPACICDAFSYGYPVEGAE